MVVGRTELHSALEARDGARTSDIFLSKQGRVSSWVGARLCSQAKLFEMEQFERFVKPGMSRRKFAVVGNEVPSLFIFGNRKKRKENLKFFLPNWLKEELHWLALYVIWGLKSKKTILWCPSQTFEICRGTQLHRRKTDLTTTHRFCQNELSLWGQKFSLCFEENVAHATRLRHDLENITSVQKHTRYERTEVARKDPNLCSKQSPENFKVFKMRRVNSALATTKCSKLLLWQLKTCCHRTVT